MGRRESRVREAVQGGRVSLRARLEAICDGLPPGSAVTLQADWLREQLATEPEDEALADLTVEQVAAELDRSPSTIRGWLGSGELSGYRLNGREWRVPRAAVREYLDGQRNGTGKEARRTNAKAADLSAWRRERRGTA